MLSEVDHLYPSRSQDAQAGGTEIYTSPIKYTNPENEIAIDIM